MTPAQNLQRRESAAPAPQPAVSQGPSAGPDLAMGLDEQEWASSSAGAVQLSAAPAADGGGAPSDASVLATAGAGVAGAGSALPFQDQIQRSFGRHDVSGIRAHVGGAASNAARAIGAEAYATGSNVAFAGQPDLHTTAHEAAHVVQQQGGVQLKGGVGEAGDQYEQHADAVADRVVRGESAQDLLDEAAPSGGSAGGAPVQRHVQRLLAQDVSKVALAPVNKQFPGVPAGSDNPTPGMQLFSGKMGGSITHTLVGAGQSVKQAIDAITGPGRPDGGTVESMITGVFPQRYPDLYNAVGFNWYLGSHASYGYGASFPVSTYFNKLVYPTDPGGPWTSMQGFDYNRSGTSDEYNARIDVGNNILAKIAGASFWGQQELRNVNDAELFGQWTVRTINQPWKSILSKSAETDAFIAMLAPTGPAGVAAWYEHIRSAGAWEGSTADKWLDATFADEAKQTGVFRSLQSLYVAGATAANADLDLLVDAMKAMINNPKTSKGRKSAVETRVLNMPMFSKVRIDEGMAGLGDDPTKTPDTTDANLDVERMAGHVLAQRSLLPELRAGFDPIKTAQSYPIDKNPQMGVFLSDVVISDAQILRDRISRFFHDEVTPGKFAPSDKGSPGDDQASRAIAIARVGAMEAVNEAVAGRQISGLTGHAGLELGLTKVHADFIGDPLVPNKDMAKLADSTSSVAADMVLQDYRAIMAAAESLNHAGASDADRRRSTGLTDFNNRVQLYALSKNINDLRMAVDNNALATDKAIDTKGLQGLLAAQAGNAKVETITAFESAFKDYKTNFLENLENLLKSKTESSEYVEHGIGSVELSKEGLEALAVLKHADTELVEGIEAVAPFLGVAAAAASFAIGVFNHIQKFRLEKAAEESRKKMEAVLDKARDGQIGKIEAAANAETAHYAKGEVRSGEGVEEWVTGIEGGKEGGAGPKFIDLTKLDRAKMETMFRALVGAPGASYLELYEIMLAMISKAGDPIWLEAKRQLGAMWGTI